MLADQGGWVLRGPGTPSIYSLTVEKSSQEGLASEQHGRLEVVLMVEVEVLKEKQSSSPLRVWGRQPGSGWNLASRQQAAQSPGMHTALHGLSMCV